MKEPETLKSELFQHPVEATKIHLDRAIDIMRKNSLIRPEDWTWFIKYLQWMLDNLWEWRGEKIGKEVLDKSKEQLDD